MMTENITLTEEMRDEMFKYALEVINEDSFSGNNWTKLHEEDKFYNWYHGYTMIESPSYASDGLYIYINTSATSGVVTTQHYGDPFIPELVERKLLYRVRVHAPKSVKRNENVTLHFKVEKVSMTGLASNSKDKVRMAMGDGLGLGNLDADQTTAYKNFTPSGNTKRMDLSRDVSSEDVEAQRLDLMPGFKFSWWYTGAEITPYNKFKDNEMNKQFVR